MNNFFLATQPFAKDDRRLARIRRSGVKAINSLLASLKTGCQLTILPNPLVDMTTVEQRVNYFHLLEAVIANQIDGDVVELGCFTGQCALLFGQILRLRNSDKELHLYDSFETSFKVKGSVEQTLQSNFKQLQLPLPILHKGYFQTTIPKQLPANIAFVHIDCGFGGDTLQHKDTILYCLEAVYPRMSKGAVCVLMDYHDADAQDAGYDLNPGVKMACDEFFKLKPERITCLYGNQYSHGFFRKA